MDALADAISSADFEAAHQLVLDGADWTLKSYQERQAIDRIIRGEAFDLLKLLFEKDIISSDIFEYDRFDGTIFEKLLSVPFTEALLSFLGGFVSDVDNIDDDLQGKTWLGLAIAKKVDPRFIECLVSGGCDINRIDMKEQNYLFGVKDVETAKSLIDQGLDVNQKNIAGQTVLFGAISTGNKELIQLLIDNGAELNVQDNQGETPYNIVCFNIMDADVMAQMAEYDPPRFDLHNKQNQSLMMQFCDSHFVGDTSVNLLKLLIEYGGDLFEESVDFYGRAMTPAEKLAPKKADVIQAVIDLDNFDPAAIDNRGNNWLHMVCAQNLINDAARAKEFYRKVKILLKAGVDPSQKNDEDKSPIDLAQDDNMKSKGLEIMLKAQM